MTARLEPGAAAPLEQAAREKAWTDFLTEVAMSLVVWEIDEEVRNGCETVPVWLGRCADDLARWAQ